MIVESRARWGQRVQLVILVYQDLRDPKDHRDPVDAPSWGPQVLKVREDRKVKLDNKERREFLVELENQAERDLQDPEDCQEKTDPQAERAPQGLLGLQEPQGPQETRALQENRENWDHRVLLETRETRVNGVTSSRQHQFRPSPGRSVSS